MPDSPAVLAAYVTGHGFGHWTRLGVVLAEVRARRPDLPITVVGRVPEALVRRAVLPPLSIRPVACDAGLVQADALTIDEAASAARCAAFDSEWEVRLAAEARFLRTSGARLVLADLPALPFAAAARAGVPAIGLGNFTWDWIYRHLAARQPSLAASAGRAAAAYAEGELLLELPFAGDLSAFRRRVEVGLVARRPRVDREEARRRLGLDGRPAALVSFGGVGFPGLRREALARTPGLAWLLPEALGEARLVELGLDYHDLVGAADVVVTKPGYGIVSDAVAAGTRLVYTDRGDFPEYPILVRELPRWLAAVHVERSALEAGLLEAPIRQVLALPMPAPPPLDGAARAADLLLARMG
jgi:hypothetical protein